MRPLITPHLRVLTMTALIAGLAAFWAGGPSLALVSAQDAATLKSRLTPVGAERAGNEDGTIPAWTGGVTSAPGYVSGAPRPDPFAADKPLFSITARNFRDHADKLPEGARALFAKYPDYRMDIYPSHRSAAAPDWVYDNIFRNATRAHAPSEGIAYGVEGAVGGIPFPIPQNGFEAMWNHLLAFWGPARELTVSTYIVPAGGAAEKASSYKEIADFPYYYQGATPESLGGYYFKTLHLAVAPAARAGEAYLNWQPINIRRNSFAAWRLLPGEHRVRKAPGISYDVPDADAAGFVSLDEYYLFFGGLDRYSFKLLGKREMYIPYNNNRLPSRPVNEILGRDHANPDDLRYELHRVWVVEGTLASGAHHVAARRRLYLDEDSWMAVYSDSWDESGRLWKFGQASMYLMPDVPAIIVGSQFVYDLQLGGYAFGFAFNGEPSSYKVTAPHPATLFTPDSLSARAPR
ncbi:MAG TPA: DUF1329 domain-containing protein [Rhizomicrobium sp.]|nr:DUF1329 domain-containing protein [Rhizomicrobium sp.]